MNRIQLQEMSQQRLAEAKILQEHDFWSGAYYLAGYSIELAIKCCILKRVEATGVIFVDKTFQQKCWTHELLTLMKSADLEPELGLSEQSDLAFKSNWNIVKDWNEASRYQQIGQTKAQALIDAIEDPNAGVLQWLKRQW